MARELAEQLLVLAQRLQDPVYLIEAYLALGNTLFWLGEFALARVYLEQAIALYDVQQHRSLAFLYGTDPAVVCLSYAARALWLLGYPDQPAGEAPRRSRWPRLSHSPSLAVALPWASYLISPAGKCCWCKSAPRRSWGSLPSRDFSGGWQWELFSGLGIGRAGETERRRDGPAAPGAGRLLDHRVQSRNRRIGLPSWLRRMGQLERPKRGCAGSGRRW